MNHQPFRDWLLSDEQLSERETVALQDHLRKCESCSQISSAWKEIELELKRAPQVAPAAGFTQRFQAHLNEHQARRQARGGWFTIAVTSSVVTTLFIILAMQIWSLIQAPDAFLAMWLNRLVSLVSLYYMVENFTGLNSRYIPLYTIFGTVFLVGIISFMSVLWLATYRKFSLARRML
jgi:anti-sigma factor RsiW